MAHYYWTRDGDVLSAFSQPVPEWLRQFLDPEEGRLTPADHSFTDRPSNRGDDHD